MADAPNKTTHAQRRRAEARDAARDRLRAWQFLRRLREIDAVLAEKWETLEQAAIQALRLRADIQFRQLAKVMPDRKAIEHSGEIHHRDVTEHSDADLADIASSGSPRVAEATLCPPEPDAVH
jgi:hypothetical protein